LCYVLVKAAALAARIQDSLNGVVLECAIFQSMRESLEQIGSVVALA
jgi:hypothetical protein